MFTAATLAERIRTRFFNEAGDLESLMATEVASSRLPGEEHEILALQVRAHLEGLGVLQPFWMTPRSKKSGSMLPIPSLSRAQAWGEKLMWI